jgi:alkaline phosphatase D
VAERADLDAVIHLGDYIYEYGTNQYGTVRAYEPANEILTLSDYRTRYAQYRRDTDTQSLHRQHPMIAIWDDHEFADNAYKDGALNHDPATEGSWATRVANATQAYYEWMPTRVPDPTNLRKNYRRFSIGTMIDLFMLEERVGFRDLQIQPTVNLGSGSEDTGPFMQTGSFADATRQMLGSVEEQWLFDGLRSSTANWKLLGQGVMMAQLKTVGAPNATGTSTYLNSDQWDGYDPARTRLFNAIAGDASNAAVNNVVVLTGDIHSSWAADLTPDPNNPMTALGGYNPLTGEGAIAVEYVCPSVTSPGLSELASVQDALTVNNPHFKYIDLSQHGYIVLDVTADRVSGEWWYVGDITTSGVTTDTFGTAYEVQRDANHLVAGTQSDPKPNPPPLAP